MKFTLTTEPWDLSPLQRAYDNREPEYIRDIYDDVESEFFNSDIEKSISSHIERVIYKLMTKGVLTEGKYTKLMKEHASSCDDFPLNLELSTMINDFIYKIQGYIADI